MRTTTAASIAVAALVCMPAGASIMYGMDALPEGGYSVPADKLLSMPDDFDTRQAFPGCIHAVLDQGKCGSCWAFAATETLSDRLCIESDGGVNVTLSPGDLLSCERLNLGCTMGSMPEWAWSYLEKTGVRSLGCIPYTSGAGDTQKCEPSGGCAAGLNASASAKRYSALNYTHCGSTVNAASHVLAIQQCLLHGPVDATFNVYADFDSKAGQGAVYAKGKDAGGYKGLHSVKVVGWGVQHTNSSSSTPYWLVQNSWGSSWGFEGGFFKILRGSNNCGFEEQVFTGAAKI